MEQILNMYLSLTYHIFFGSSSSITFEFDIEKLTCRSLLGNRVNGSIPKELGNISTLISLTVEDNMMSGVIPDELGKLTSIERLLLNSNFFTGELPASFANLINMKELLVLLPCWIQLLFDHHMVRRIQASGLEGPIPPSITLLATLTDLILRNCSLIGELPKSISSTNLALLDFSFNKLIGSIPERNFFASFSMDNISQRIGENEYESDTQPGGASYFSSFESRWGFSNTGNFLDDKSRDSYIAQKPSGVPMITSELYTSARTSALSLTYYGFCMHNGNYNVSLHFAEIMFIDDGTYSSLGRRLFDIYIQKCRWQCRKVELAFKDVSVANDQLVEKDFDISARAGGAMKAYVETYPVNITTSLEIRLYWAGKGKTNIPFRGVYGPLISAISVDPNFPVPKSRGNGNGVSGGIVAGIVVGAVCAIILILGVLWWQGCLRHRDMELDLHGLELNGLEFNTGSFTLKQIKAATNNFDVANKIGEGGFGPVYKGVLPNGTLIAVKQLSSKSKQGNREFLNELGMISALQHPHLVKLYGCCIEGNQLLIAYEYLENNSLARALFGPKEWQLELDWPTRYRICIGIARGLAFLHEESRLKIVHRDIKATNVLLDKNLNAKISDFGLAKLDEEDDTHISTRVAGTYGYMAPEYALRGYLTDKADVYSYGIVLLEIVSGMANIADRAKENQFVLLDRAIALKAAGNLMDLVDPKLGSEYDIPEMMVVINLALMCTTYSSTDRPTMSSVVSMLEGRIVPESFIAEQTASLTETDRQKMMKQFENRYENQTEEISYAYTDSSTSAVDLYPVDRFSEYLEKRESDAKKLLS
ncbi:hypothetical protein L1987_19223 [Smallanthus sonchifolius]|uniref:Uncharacterized protein n=1 Tax=Smallanthus sonchifolius TaxID=185202 RepID=A0ACB9IP88_9ASTR|nr:hypothetical protein L1987_19223 [Smallanthus sonchifolius]